MPTESTPAMDRMWLMWPDDHDDGDDDDDGDGDDGDDDDDHVHWDWIFHSKVDEAGKWGWMRWGWESERVDEA